MNELKRTPGRPSGRTEQGKLKKQQLYRVGLELIREEGFEKATLRKMARKADVSPGLFYKYFPSKASLILELHEELTTDFEQRWENLSSRGWPERSVETLRLSIETLKPYRKSLQALIPILVGSVDQNIFSGFSEFSRVRVQKLFNRALTESSKPPPPDLVDPLARLFYITHLAILLFWLLDKSKNQQATEGMIQFYGKLMKPLSLAVKLGTAKKMIKQVDKLFDEGLATD